MNNQPCIARNWHRGESNGYPLMPVPPGSEDCRRNLLKNWKILLRWIIFNSNETHILWASQNSKNKFGNLLKYWLKNYFAFENFSRGIRLSFSPFPLSFSCSTEFHVAYSPFSLPQCWLLEWFASLNHKFLTTVLAIVKFT